MGFFVPQRPIRGSLVSSLGSPSGWSIRRRLLAAILPLITLILLSVGYATKWVAGRYLSMALERTTKVLTMGQADAVGDLFEQARQDILLLARGERTGEAGHRFLSVQSHIKSGIYREVSYISVGGETQEYFVDGGREICRVGKDYVGRVINSAVLAPSRMAEPRLGVVALLDMAEVIYPPGVLPDAGAGATFSVFRLVTPVADQQGKIAGFWVLSVDGRATRDILSLYNSPKSPLAAFPRTAEKRYSFFFDRNGWILFQSGNIEEREQPLSTDLARSGLTGDHGMPGFPGAFRPTAANEAYWRMVVDVQAGRTDIENVSPVLDLNAGGHDSYSLGFAPVLFKTYPDKAPEVLGGVAFMDKSRLLLAADYRIYDVLLVIFIVALALTVGMICVVSRVITRPMLDLSSAVRAMSQDGVLEPIKLPDRDRETTSVKDSVNHLLEALLFQREELRLKDAHIKDNFLRQPLDLGEKLSASPDPDPIEGIIGTSQAMRGLKWLIRKAASVDPDVLIIGETGTGKEVSAQAIHKLSHRAKGPFISINCGALDENLLLDALFGHVKGAFSEAKGERKGAFLAAQGGTILLDEIGNASPKVQQALLRALAARTIIPLGSDEEIPFDARVMAATNVDLLECVKEGTFREDLYYRLKVITLNVPPLRERMEDIPLLVDAFLKESARVMNKPSMTLSRGAWERMTAHNWPGNVRELKHCLMRAVAMADSDTILVEDLRFDAQTPITQWKAPSEPGREDAASSDEIPRAQPQPAQRAEPPSLDGLSERQRTGIAYLQEHGSMSRAKYQAIVGENVPPRTAQYDLRDLVERGLLTVKGKGPATKYVLAGGHSHAR
ncbi:sigma-54-dependent transcriptional regulator [Fundidesulfovibrio terrae]|uniref:sigma-54-dependent transcriptional regulator n=1 Tax=Fundidesulfovibrio terrae TaxID=2922866 RepID=UPI001FB02435|nr:sigma-54 dependent transcriptional regulator [Fundidesulfovibrio terrae]